MSSEIASLLVCGPAAVVLGVLFAALFNIDSRIGRALSELKKMRETLDDALRELEKMNDALDKQQRNFPDDNSIQDHPR